MDLLSRIKDDSKKIHNGTLGAGSFNTPCKFTSSDDLSNETIQILYNDTSLDISIETGLPIIGSKIAISFFQDDLTIWNGTDDLQRWKIEFTNNVSQSIIAEIDSVMPDRSIGDVVCICKIISGH